MNTKSNRPPDIQTVQSSKEDNQFPQLIASLSTISSSSSSVIEDRIPCLTPRDQPIMTRDKREKLAQDFVCDVGLQWSGCSSEQQIRAMKIQSSDFTWSPNRGEAPQNERYTTTFKNEWNTFVHDLPDDHKAALSTYDNVFFDEEAVSNAMAICRQLSGICSSHASVLFQHYVQSCRKGFHKENHKMPDISSFIRNHLPTYYQRRYVQEGVTGLGSSDLVQLFTGTKSSMYTEINPFPKCDSETHHNSDVKTIFDCFVKHQEPALVSRFRVGAEFFENHILQGVLDEKRYEEIVKSKGKASLHAMVLIGAYHLDHSGYWFVLQNTHKDGYFKLVNGEYLASCDVVVSFAWEKADMSLKEKYDVVSGEYIEAALDMEECMSEFLAEG